MMVNYQVGARCIAPCGVDLDASRSRATRGDCAPTEPRQTDARGTRRSVAWAVLSKMLALCILLVVLAEVAEARVVTVRWSNSNAASAVAGFRIYTRATGQSFGAPAYVGTPVAVAGVYSIQLTVSDAVGTYVTATAYNSTGESARSNEQFFAAPVCGNAVVDSGEGCDDGNTVSWDSCSATCAVEVPVCGNGHRQGAETCDDGNTVSGDGCSSTCSLELAICGNGIRQGAETCDDGNTTSLDGCSSRCTVEVATCGNGIRQGAEACDDGNTNSWDGCSATCTVEVATCGNGHRQGAEACDDGNTNSWDGCSATCTVEVATCGNGHRQGAEACDDGNVVAGDGCSASCLVESSSNALPEYLINAGGEGFAESKGKVWSADRGFANGGRTAFNNVPIDLTNNDRLYQSQRYGQAGGPPLVLEFPVTGTGPYRVRLHFAELDAAITQPGMRVFNVNVENAVTIPSVDVFAKIGFARALSRIVYVNVDDGALTISFEPVVGVPMIAGVEIIEQEPPTSAPEFIDPCVEFPESCQEVSRPRLRRGVGGYRPSRSHATD